MEEVASDGALKASAPYTSALLARKSESAVVEARPAVRVSLLDRG
jgi:hypothetical protein